MSHPPAGEPSLLELVRWLTSHTRPVHKPLYLSTVLRVINLSCDIVIFALASGGLVAVLLGELSAINVIAGLVGFALLKATAYYGEQFSGHYVAFRALELLRTMVFAQLLPKAPAIAFRSRSGDLLASITRDVDRIEVVYAHTFAPVISALVVPPVFVIGAGVTWGWQVAFVPGICVALALLVVPLLDLRGSFTATRVTLARRRDLAGHVTDTVFGVQEVVGYGREADRLAQMGQIETEIAQSAAVARRGSAVRRASNHALMLLSLIGVVVAATDRGLPVAVVATLAVGSLRLFEGPRGVEDAAGYLDHSLAAARRLWDIAHAPQVVISGEKALPEDVKALSVSWRGVSYRYSHALENALTDVDFTVGAGQYAVLVGRSGSGKTTATKLLLRYDDPDSGQITVGGVNVRDLSLESLRSRVVMVTQRNDLIDSSVRANVALGRADAGDTEIWHALQVACVAQEVREMPGGLDAPVGEGGSRLSGGQAQRICLARALLMKPAVLVLDEFTAQLNPTLEREIRANMRALGVTVIEVSHRLEATTVADKIIEFDRGTSTTRGSFFASGGNDV